ncbi:hypothetical protein ACFVL4_13670 [Bacillus subtilis]|uniref:TrbC/VirB2 family protein n=1 Tax=Bacillus subtilis TaxID=1423 RepID=B7U585_BACIU|nr:MULTISPECIES: hypothetical protein [Bacillus]ACJ66888.1 hypothetical protein Bsb_03 [Bacillus subtilis]APB62285.1 hypothetical protein pBS72_0160 [Bacillus subtilis]MEC2297453.1 hypothetical protein [Bacillus subtilis]NUF07772.1 hypothetical protein [Bacillus rugosus]ODV48174.1 hypothetical protein BCM26_04295 [Bacillus subtilis]
MDQLVSSLTSTLAWIQKPAIIGACIMFAISGYFFMAMGQNGTRIGKVMLVSTLIGLILIIGANALVTSFQGNIKF